ncbi:5561_t:CDS:2, partial [Cetraspora pellucida]
SNYSIIAGIAAIEFETNKEMNQVISISKSRLKFALKNRLINEFIRLITRFIKDHSGVATNKCMTVDIFQIENSKKLKHKGHPRLHQNTLQDLNISQDLNLK